MRGETVVLCRLWKSCKEKGNLLCEVYGINKIVCRGSLPVVFFIGEEKHYPWDLEPGGLELQRISEYGSKAQDRFTATRIGPNWRKPILRKVTFRRPVHILA